MRILLGLCLIVTVVGSCQFGSEQRLERPNIFKDTLTYTYNTIHERAPDCGNKADSACTVAKVRYPVFKNAPLLNDTIVKRLTSLYPAYTDKKRDTTLRAMVGSFMKAYAEFNKSLSKSSSGIASPKQPANSKTDAAPARQTEPNSANAQRSVFFTIDIYSKVVFQDSAVVALEYGGYTYEGGAHGATFTGFINWNPIIKKEVHLKDVLIDGYNEKLTHIADSIFRKNEKLKDTSSLARDYFFKDNKFALNNNYSLTPIGIRFIYNQYEIKPFAAGQTELLIPYDKIKELIRPKSVIARYIKNDVGI